ncbi:MAG: tetratricopeptide repeat protein [Pyrinomonadaceae bacterium]
MLRYRTIIAILFAFVLTVGVTALWSAATDGHGDDDAANIVAADGSATGLGNIEIEPATKKKSGLGRFFKAPFKAIGKLFNGKDDPKRMQRPNEGDMAKFESAPTMRVNDALTPVDKQEEGDQSAKDYLERGQDLLGEGKLSEAITTLSRAVSLDPRLSKAHNLLAIAYERRGMPERAKDAFERSLAINREDAETLNNLGYSLYLNGNYRAAVERLKRAAKLAPADERVWNNLALAQSRLGKYDDAYKSFKRAGGELTGRLNVAALLERAGRERDAIEHYEAARKLQPTSETALNRLADLYQRSGRADKAEEVKRALANRTGDQIAAEGR